MTWVEIVVALLMLAGLIGAALPLLPGTPLILAGALDLRDRDGLHADRCRTARGAGPAGRRRLCCWRTWRPRWALRGAGGSRWAMVGALAGAILGLHGAARRPVARAAARRDFGGAVADPPAGRQRAGRRGCRGGPGGRRPSPTSRWRSRWWRYSPGGCGGDRSTGRKSGDRRAEKHRAPARREASPAAPPRAALSAQQPEAP